MIQDIKPHVFHNEYRPGAVPREDSPVLRFKDKNPLARMVETTIEVDETDEGCYGFRQEMVLEFPTVKEVEGAELVYAFAMDETEYFLDISGCTDEVEGFTYMDFREYRKTVGHVPGMIAFTGVHLYQWYMTNKFCGSCSAVTLHSETERAKVCPKCGNTIYPNIQPAVIVGITNGDKLLMTKYRVGIGYYALVAGFVEIGETFEECVQREVMEETGLKVKNIRYYKSQPWGTAKDVLAGFYCDLDGDGEIHMDTNELKLAQWVKKEDIELQPDDYSLTNEMMRMFKEGKLRI